MKKSSYRHLSGVFLLNKPLGLSSNSALQKVRRLFNAQKAGHTGALDPLATGLLPICLGEATKFSHYLLDKWIRNLDNELQNVLIFGHNPAFTDITNQLGNEMIYNLSTSGFVWIQFDSDNWKSIEKGKTIKIILPKEIK